MSRFLKLVLIAVIGVTVAAVFASQAIPSQAQGGNLLVDADFEAPPTWPQQDGVGEVQVAPGWRAWYLDVPPDYVKSPVNCNESPSYAYNCYWMRPEFRDNVAASFANRVHGGIRSQKYFSYGRMHEAGLYQQVGGITPGKTLRFAIYMQAWQCFDIDKCGKDGTRSDAPAEMHLRVGIDPYGGTDPFSPNIIWSGEQPAFDQWVEFSVEAVARNSTVTVFTHSRPDWMWARMSNDVYLDDASLIVLDKPAYVPPVPVNLPVVAAPPVLRQPRFRFIPDADTYTPAAPAVKSGTSAAVTPVGATTPPPPGSPRTYVVVAGDTLTLIAQRFNTTVAALVQANNLPNVDFIWIGQTLIIP